MIISCFCIVNCLAQEEPKVVQLWNNVIPNAIENQEFNEKEVIKDAVVTGLEQVSVPTLTVFKPENPNGTAIVICPGGGYHHLSINKEGYKVARWLNTLGVTAFVLKYRLPNDAIMEDKRIGPLQDAQEAMRYVRRNSEAYQIHSDKIGVLGFSAGGHLAASVSTQYDKEVYKVEDNTSARPDFLILIYPVISMDESITHNGSRKKLLGESPSNEDIEAYSNETHINSDTPKTFLVHATDDKSVPVENSIRYYLGLKENDVPSEMHIYETGGHGFGMGRNSTHPWVKACEQWLKSSKYLTTNNN